MLRQNIQRNSIDVPKYNNPSSLIYQLHSSNNYSNNICKPTDTVNNEQLNISKINNISMNENSDYFKKLSKASKNMENTNRSRENLVKNTENIQKLIGDDDILFDEINKNSLY